jgi:hypothetical protein
MEVSGQLHVSDTLFRGETTSDTHQMAWLGPKASLNFVEKEKVSFLCKEWNLDTFVVRNIDNIPTEPAQLLVNPIAASF